MLETRWEPAHEAHTFCPPLVWQHGSPAAAQSAWLRENCAPLAPAVG